MGRFAIVAFRPLPGKEDKLMAVTKDHLPILRSQGLVTDRESYVMRASDGTIIEVFEWKSSKAIEEAHKNPAVLAMWQKYSEACEYVTLSSLKEFSNLFAEFEPVNP